MAKLLEEVLWTWLKRECNLDQQHVQIAKRLNVMLEHLADCHHEQLKLHLNHELKLLITKFLTTVNHRSMKKFKKMG